MWETMHLPLVIAMVTTAQFSIKKKVDLCGFVND
jgi:hypothetical protein